VGVVFCHHSYIIFTVHFSNITLSPTEKHDSVSFREGVLWDELKESIEEFKSPDRANLKQLLTEYKVNKLKVES
jgi:hypothetical protein